MRTSPSMGRGSWAISSSHIYTALPLGGLAPGAFVIGTSAQQSDDRIIYDPTTGALYYDADGNGAVAAVHFATLQGSPVLAPFDFNVT